MPSKIDDIHPGDVIGKWTVLGETRSKNPKNKERYFLCRCECGNIKPVRSFVLRHHLTEGCVKCKRSGATKHGESKHGQVSRLYIVWQGMMRRCYNKKNKSYYLYGERGITVCEKWHDYSAFRKWAIDNGYDETAMTGECTIDRIDTNGNYDPDNCRFVDMKTQNLNKRNNIYITAFGRTMTVVEWSGVAGINCHTLRNRLSRGWLPEDALTLEVGIKHKEHKHINNIFREKVCINESI